jgi:hypothetical protein
VEGYKPGKAVVVEQCYRPSRFGHCPKSQPTCDNHIRATPEGEGTIASDEYTSYVSYISIGRCTAFTYQPVGTLIIYYICVVPILL